MPDDGAPGARHAVPGPRAAMCLAALALLLVGSQAMLALLAGRITHTSAVEVRTVMPLLVLLMVPAALGLAAGPTLARAGDSRRMLAVMALTGLVMRLVWFASPAPVEDDYNRYLLDGAVVAAGLNPYAYAPEQLSSAVPDGFADVVAAGRPVIERINFPELTSIYPGAAQIVFALAHAVAPWRIDGLRAVFLLADVATLLLLMRVLAQGRRPRLLAAYYWCNPLVVLATTATLHVDAVLPPLLLAAILCVWWRHHRAAAALLAVAVGIKLWPLLLAPLFAGVMLDRPVLGPAAVGERRSLVERARGVLAPAAIFAGVVTVTCLPLLLAAAGSRSGLLAYGTGWATNNAVFAWAEDVIEILADGHVDVDVGWWLRIASACLGGVVAIVVAARWQGLDGQRGFDAMLASSLVVAASVFYLSPAQFPWYALWFLALAAALSFRPLLLASVLLPVYYLSFPFSAAGEEDSFSFGIALVHALPVFVWCAFALVSLRRSRQGTVCMEQPNAAEPSPGSVVDHAAQRRIGVVIPVRNEAEALPLVLSRIPRWVQVVIVADYRSDDGTPDIARLHGAVVVDVAKPGYGFACLSGIAELPDDIEIVVFVDGDASDEPGEMLSLVAPIARGQADLVIGSRTSGHRESGALTPQQVFGNWLACRLIGLVWGGRCTDLGPFRAISRAGLAAIGMRDETFGWTVEMQVLAAKRGLRVVEVPVTYRRRIGHSKISGTINGVVRAGCKILWVIGREAVAPNRTGAAAVPLRRSDESAIVSRPDG